MAKGGEPRRQVITAVEQRDGLLIDVCEVALDFARRMAGTMLASYPLPFVLLIRLSAKRRSTCFEAGDKAFSTRPRGT